MFLLSLLRQIYKSASLGLKNLVMESKNGIRLVLRLAFTPKKWTLQWKLGSLFCFIIISAFYIFLGFEIYKIINLLCYWLCCMFASKVIIFQEALQFRSIIVLCYSKQTTMRVSSQVPPPLNWNKKNFFFGWNTYQP
jgi:hypothetical protein